MNTTRVARKQQPKKKKRAYNLSDTALDRLDQIAQHIATGPSAVLERLIRGDLPSMPPEFSECV